MQKHKKHKTNLNFTVMKTCIRLSITLLLGVLLTSACSSKKAKDVKKEANEAVQEAKSFVSDESDEFLSKVDNFMTDNKEKVATYKSQVTKMDEKIRKDLNTKLLDIDADIKKIEQKKEDYKNAAKEKKDVLKVEISNLKDALANHIKEFEKGLKENEVSINK